VNKYQQKEGNREGSNKNVDEACREPTAEMAKTILDCGVSKV
jgi:hypothetical protein